MRSRQLPIRDSTAAWQCTPRHEEKKKSSYFPLSTIRLLTRKKGKHQLDSESERKSQEQGEREKEDSSVVCAYCNRASAQSLITAFVFFFFCFFYLFSTFLSGRRSKSPTHWWTPFSVVSQRLLLLPPSLLTAHSTIARDEITSRRNTTQLNHNTAILFSRYSISLTADVSSFWTDLNEYWRKKKEKKLLYLAIANVSDESHSVQVVLLKFFSSVHSSGFFVCAEEATRRSAGSVLLLIDPVPQRSAGCARNISIGCKRGRWADCSVAHIAIAICAATDYVAAARWCLSARDLPARSDPNET